MCTAKNPRQHFPPFSPAGFKVAVDLVVTTRMPGTQEFEGSDGEDWSSQESVGSK